MDVSKLPRLSETKPPEPAPPSPDPQAQSNSPSPAPPRTVDYGSDRVAIGAEIWFGLIIGLILMLYTAQFGKYLIATATGHQYHTGVTWTEGPNDGKEVPYPQLEY